MQSSISLLLAICLVSFNPAFAQAAPNSSAPTSTAAASPAASSGPDASGKYTVHEGDEVDLTFAQDLSSKTASEGDPVALTLSDDLKIGNVVLAKAGAHAFGEVSRAEKAGMMGRGGQLNLRLNYLKVGDTKIKLRGTKGKEGDNATGSTIALTVLFGPIGLIKHGKNVEIKQGQALKAYVAEDIALIPAS